ncbi:thiosulfate/3-mercaptopyruvate sulfurtransferase [Amycolatopsis xylanica]|uniref:Thiosulfate/3-mercaptopyruvate sulfurtransferase n=1 Tax=Amycolatopsis xylanica TaxID=589385 RepID=A0A1H3Q406_9PSEU|nr:sulfurtransferase [Amycolatopsis xylanica]SDZ07469.1 thiosulfate/3-mercaptopyruvate sulfurtransferase [Amycolatopsis xylanica]
MLPLITTTALSVMLDGPEDGRPVLLDVRWRLGGPPGIEAYQAGHLPRAVYVDLDTALASEPGEGGRHPLPEPAQLQAHLRAAGVHEGHPVVVYDDADGSIAARAWWLLRWAGHTEVAVLDGGFAAWQAEGKPVTTEVPVPVPGDIEVRPGQMPVLDADEAAELARKGVLLDARARPRYAGEVEPIDPAAGHIPGALNAPFSAHAAEDGRWRTAEELKAHFAELDVTEAGNVGAYCGSGVTASSVVLALEVAGHPGTALYTGSWSHWSRDPSRPVATGDAPG